MKFIVRYSISELFDDIFAAVPSSSVQQSKKILLPTYAV